MSTLGSTKQGLGTTLYKQLIINKINFIKPWSGFRFSKKPHLFLFKIKYAKFSKTRNQAFKSVSLRVRM
jgi:hypothetical protein